MSKPKIYIFLNGTVADISTYVAVAEDGFCLASVSLPIVHVAHEARIKLSEHTKWVQNYNQHYSDGFEIEWIENISAPEHAGLLARIREVTSERADERMEQRKLAAELIKSIEIRSLTEVELAEFAASKN